MPFAGLPQAIAWCAFASVCLAPFLFGAVERTVWIPLCLLWLGLGLASTMVGSQMRSSELWLLDRRATGLAVSRALLPLHALFALQLVPMPAAVLRALSPGSFAAHFLPDPGDARFRPLSVSPAATAEAWLYVVGLQGLFLALQGVGLRKRRALVWVIVAVILVLAAEGLWQSRSPHPFWLYGQVPIYAPQGLQDSPFGPYFNRNHFATAMAMGAGLAAGLAATLTQERGGGVARLLSDPASLSKVVLLTGASAALAVTSVASGSRSGTLAAITGIGVVAARAFSRRVLLIGLGLGIALLALTGGTAIDRLLRLDVLASRWRPWMDMSNLVRFFPAFGSGIGTFAATYWPYQTNVTYEFWQHAHNDYLQWAIEGGLAGGLVLYSVFRLLVPRVEFHPQGREGALGAAAAFAAQALLDFPLHIPANSAVLVCVLALAVSGRPRTLTEGLSESERRGP